ncbi:unnamed protein product [Cutaneotrichosporon oleaginosum]
MSDEYTRGCYKPAFSAGGCSTSLSSASQNMRNPLTLLSFAITAVAAQSSSSAVSTSYASGAVASGNATATSLNSTAAAGPYWHTFINDTIANATLWPKARTIDFNKVSLAGYRSNELRGAAGSFANLTAEERKAIVDDFHAHNKTLRVSAFGANDNVTSNGTDPEVVATNLAAYAKQNGLDGVDINYEDRGAIANGSAVDWLETFHAKLVTELGEGSELTYSPVGSFFGGSDAPFVRFLSNKKKDVKWLMIQFYDRGRFNWTTPEQLFETTGQEEFKSRAEIAQLLGGEWTENDLVVQKPLQENQPGRMSAEDLAAAFCAKNETLNGLSVWRLNYANVTTANDYLARVRTAATCKDGKPASPVANVSSPNASAPATTGTGGAVVVSFNGLTAAAGIIVALAACALIL